MPLLNEGDQFPSLVVDRVGGGEIVLPDDLQGQYGVVLFNHGSWCPYCVTQLMGFTKTCPTWTPSGRPWCPSPPTRRRTRARWWTPTASRSHRAQRLAGAARGAHRRVRPQGTVLRAGDRLHPRSRRPRAAEHLLDRSSGSVERP